MDNNNMLKLCRLCLVKDDVNIPIFEEQGDIRQIFLKISSCLPVKVSRDDQLPKKICDGCSYKLDMLYEFWNTSANAEKQLLTWLGEAGMSSQMADGTISAVAQQIKPADAFVKQETIDPPDIHMDDDDDDDEEDKDYMKQEDNSNNVEEPPPKRARRTAAVKAAIALDQNSDDDDDSGEPMTKVEDDSEDSDNEDHEPAFVDVPSTSADDQPGPSGVGKDGVEAPLNEIFEEIDNINVAINNIIEETCSYANMSTNCNEEICIASSPHSPESDLSTISVENSVQVDNDEHNKDIEEDVISVSDSEETVDNNIEILDDEIEETNDMEESDPLSISKTSQMDTLVEDTPFGLHRKFICAICDKSFETESTYLCHKSLESSNGLHTRPNVKIQKVYPTISNATSQSATSSNTPPQREFPLIRVNPNLMPNTLPSTSQDLIIDEDSSSTFSNVPKNSSPITIDGEIYFLVPKNESARLQLQNSFKNQTTGSFIVSNPHAGHSSIANTSIHESQRPYITISKNLFDDSIDTLEFQRCIPNRNHSVPISTINPMTHKPTPMIDIEAPLIKKNFHQKRKVGRKSINHQNKINIGGKTFNLVETNLKEIETRKNNRLDTDLVSINIDGNLYDLEPVKSQKKISSCNTEPIFEEGVMTLGKKIYKLKSVLKKKKKKNVLHNRSYKRDESRLNLEHCYNGNKNKMVKVTNITPIAYYKSNDKDAVLPKITNIMSVESDMAQSDGITVLTDDGAPLNTILCASVSENDDIESALPMTLIVNESAMREKFSETQPIVID
ncbi:uncharacterized protein LOC130897056 isoform X6 [Diorhabda carinulata]|uniref:uncharacterized protein LOC130897056 isoform X6 n=1 Tax=Diorhabda carinulata TaxID=1163345 RepID=UPI0025A0899C|nr:uncharacterized protein LOC130897056 isoform X6 [Diorhabda carinulata]